MGAERLGVAVHGGTLAMAVAAARRAEAAGFESVWTTEFYDRSATVSLAAMALGTSTITVASVADDAERARRDAAAQIAFYVVVRTYAPLVELEGFGAEVARIRDAWKRRDHEAMIDAVTAEMLAAMAVAGTPDEARDQIRTFHGLYDRLLCYVPSFGLSGGEIAERIDAVVDTFGH